MDTLEIAAGVALIAVLLCGHFLIAKAVRNRRLEEMRAIADAIRDGMYVDQWPEPVLSPRERWAGYVEANLRPEEAKELAGLGIIPHYALNTKTHIPNVRP